MKRFYLLTSALLAGAFTLQAQEFDFAADVFWTGGNICEGKFASPNPDVNHPDSVYSIIGFGTTEASPNTILEGEQLWTISSTNVFLTEAEAEENDVPFEDRYYWIGPYTATAITEEAQFFGWTFYNSEEITMLLDWDLYNESDSIVILGPPHETFVAGKEYGFFGRIMGIGSSSTSLTSTDINPNNNWSVQKVVWKPTECAVSIQDMFVSKKQLDITLYPNPTQESVNVDFNFEKASYTRVVVADVTGKVVQNVDLGTMAKGQQKINVDVAKLAAGIYTLELRTAEFNAVGKFTKK